MDHDRWIRTMFAELDRGSVPALFPYLTEDVVFRFASYPSGRGRDAFAEMWSSVSPKIRALEHKVHEVWKNGSSIFCHGNVTYHLHESPPMTVPFANLFRLRDEKIAEYLIYVDASPVFGASPTPDA